jgi:hypothetical protein
MSPEDETKKIVELDVELEIVQNESTFGGGGGGGAQLTFQNLSLVRSAPKDDALEVRSAVQSSRNVSENQKKGLVKTRADQKFAQFQKRDKDFKLKQLDKAAPSFGGGPGMYSGQGMKQGEIEFGGLQGHRAYYLICPEEMESTDAVRRIRGVCFCCVSFACSYLLLFSCWCVMVHQVMMHMFGPDNSVGWKLKPPALTVYGMGGRDHYTKWIETSYYDTENGTDVWSGGRAGMSDDARRLKFKRRLQEIAGGVCQAVRK